MNIVYEKEKAAVFEKAKEHLEKSLNKALMQKEKVLFLVSGGSNVELLTMMDQELLANSNITTLPLDERYDRGEFNNSLLIQKEGIPIHTMIPKEGESVEEFGQRYHQFLANWMKENPDGEIVAVIGIGEDGHTAGISPGDEVWVETFSRLEDGTLAVGYEGKLSPPQRVTVTPEFLKKKINVGVIVANGEKKKPALVKMMSEGSKAETPARILADTQGNMTLFTDVELSK